MPGLLHEVVTSLLLLAVLGTRRADRIGYKAYNKQYNIMALFFVCEKFVCRGLADNHCFVCVGGFVFHPTP